MPEGLMTPRFVYDEADPYTIIDRWGEKESLEFNETSDASEWARISNLSCHSMLIVYRPDERMTEIRPVVPIAIEFCPQGTEHHPDKQGFYLQAYALDRGAPGKVEEARRLFPLESILAWDV